MTKEEKQLENQHTLEQFQAWIELPYTKKVLSFLDDERMAAVVAAEKQVNHNEIARKVALDSLVESRTLKYAKEMISKPVGLLSIIENPTQENDKFFLRSLGNLPPESH